MGSVGAKRGFQREALFVELLTENQSFRRAIEAAFKQTKIATGMITNAAVLKGVEKADVAVFTAEGCGIVQAVHCSLKAAEANFNQLDRRWLSDLAHIVEMPSDVQAAIQLGLDRKLIDSRAIFINEQQATIILPYFEKIKEHLLYELFTREDGLLKAFIVYNETTSEWLLANIDEIIQALKKETFSITSRGVIKLGPHFSLQRKGGDGNIKNPPKTDPAHPSNQLQFKIRPTSLIKEVNHQIINVQ